MAAETFKLLTATLLSDSCSGLDSPRAGEESFSASNSGSVDLSPDASDLSDLSPDASDLSDLSPDASDLSDLRSDAIELGALTESAGVALAALSALVKDFCANVFDFVDASELSLGDTTSIEFLVSALPRDDKPFGKMSSLTERQ